MPADGVHISGDRADHPLPDERPLDGCDPVPDLAASSNFISRASSAISAFQRFTISR
ncbi:MAG TPA: hypothetical protein VH660_01295 [Candidatus Deferrimicrobiaceae bacterium]